MFFLSFLFARVLGNKLQKELLSKYWLHMAFHHFITIVYAALKEKKKHLKEKKNHSLLAH